MEFGNRWRRMLRVSRPRREDGQSDLGIALGILGLIVAIVAVVLVAKMFVRVGTGEIAVMTRFGRVTGQELGEGFHAKSPFDHANKYDVRVQKSDATAAAASKDLQDVHSTLVLNYSLERGKVSEIHRTVGPNYAEKLIDPALQEVFKATTSGFDAVQLITERPTVKAKAVDLLRERLAKYGINVADLSITNFGFSKEFTDAIEAKQVAQQQAEKARFNLETSKTEAEAQTVQAASLSEFYLRKLWLEKWNGVLPTTIAGGDTSMLLGEGKGR